MIEYHVIEDPILQGMKIPVNPAKKEINANNTTISKSDAIKELDYLNSFESNMTQQKNSKRGLSWSQRMEYSKIWAIKFVEENISKRYKNIQIVLNNPTNIKRWKNQEGIDRDELILQNILENKKIQDQIKRDETKRLVMIEDEKNILNKNLIIPKITPVIIPEITPEIIPTAVVTSSLVPLGIIALLLYSRTGRK